MEAGATGERMASVVHPEIEQEEMPNRLVPKGARHNLASMLAAAERGKERLRSQRYEVLNAVVQGDTVVLEVAWSGTLAVDIGNLPAGFVMRARFALFMEVKDGRIYRMRNYDCFEPFSPAPSMKFCVRRIESSVFPKAERSACRLWRKSG